jgi:hypothetical protein
MTGNQGIMTDWVSHGTEKTNSCHVYRVSYITVYTCITFHTSYTSLLIHHFAYASLFIHNFACITFHTSLQMHHFSYFISHANIFIPHFACIISRESLQIITRPRSLSSGLHASHLAYDTYITSVSVQICELHQCVQNIPDNPL